MNVYTCNTFEGHYPVGTAAVVVATSRERAAEILNRQLSADGVPGRVDGNEMIPVNQHDAHAVILCDGNY